MIRNILIGLATIIILPACSSGGDTSSSSGTVTESADSATAEKEDACLNGTYEFRTPGDGKFHFDATFDGEGNAFFLWTDGDTGSYFVDGDTVTWQANGAGASWGDFVWTVTARESDCTITQFGGGAADPSVYMTATRK